MNLYYDLCAFIVIILCYMSCVLKRMFRGRTNALFYLMLTVMLVSTLGDFWGAYIQNYSAHSEANRIAEYIWEYVYFFSHNLLLATYFPFIYSSIGMWHEFKRNKKVRAIWAAYVLINIVVLISNTFYPTVFYVDEELRYSRRPGISVFYITGALIIIYQVYTLYKYRSIIRKDKFVVMLLLYPIAIAGIIVQIFLLEHLVEMFIISITLLLFCLMIRRDEELLDPITGARQYGVAHEHLKNILATETPIYMILIKIVNYKNIRMYLGQQLLYDFLREQTNRFRSFSKQDALEADIFYFDEGLYAIVTELDDYESVSRCATRIKDHYAEKLMVESFSIMVDPRICILACPKDIDNYNTLFTFCTSFHMIMPETKEVMHYPDYVNNRDFKIKSHLDDIIDRALKYRCFELHYQPIYSIIEKRFVAAEAFIRLRDDEYGMISPGMFIKAAEISGAIHAIGDFVLDDVCRFIARDDFDILGLSCIEVNMSTSQCIEMNLVEKIETLLAKYDVDPVKLNLEITESAVDFDPDVVDQNINRLNKMGINFSLDDYGTGYSNVRRVTTLPISIVKLDKTFVDGVDDPQMWIMVQDTIKMLKEMGKKVLVEGVEEEKVVWKFTDLGADYIQGCEYLQGYYFCRPLPENDFVDFMKKQVGVTV